MLNIKQLKLVVVYQNLRTDGEDFVITPFFFAVYSHKFYAIGFCLFWYAIALGIKTDSAKNQKRFYKI